MRLLLVVQNFNGEIESFLRRIEFPYTVGYGATECGPIICYRDWHSFKQGSCGQVSLTSRSTYR